VCVSFRFEATTEGSEIVVLEARDVAGKSLQSAAGIGDGWRRNIFVPAVNEKVLFSFSAKNVECGLMAWPQAEESVQ
jgi:hypothetical protein